MRFALLCLATWTVSAMAPAHAQDWKAAVFPDRAFDAGTVARGSKVRHSFRVVNTTNQEIHINSWRTKCGCTEVRIGARDIPPGTQTVVEAVLDTTKYVGFKPSGLTLVLDRPSFEEVDLNLSCFIRGDITLSPGLADFGTVARSGKPKVTMVLNYAGGQPNWDVKKIQTISEHVTAELQPISRSGGTAQYQLTATLNPTVPSGFFKDEITLQTTDPNQSIPIAVVANVQAGVTVSPSVINLGRIQAGTTVQRTILVRAAQPFKVTGVTAQKDEISLNKIPDSVQPFHSMVLTVKAPATAGPYNAAIEIKTDVPGEPPARLTAFATIVR